jgi:hypothetical protein
MLLTAIQARKDGIPFEAVLVDGEYISKESLRLLVVTVYSGLGRDYKAFWTPVYR